MVIGYRLLVIEAYCLLFIAYSLNNTTISTTKFEKYEKSRNKKI